MILLPPSRGMGVGCVGAATAASCFVVTVGLLLLFATVGGFLIWFTSTGLAVLLATTFPLGFCALLVFVCMAGRVTAFSGTGFLDRPRFFASAVVAFADMVARAMQWVRVPIACFRGIGMAEGKCESDVRYEVREGRLFFWGVEGDQ